MVVNGVVYSNNCFQVGKTRNTDFIDGVASTDEIDLSISAEPFSKFLEDARLNQGSSI